jgi:hypothetical protein
LGEEPEATNGQPAGSRLTITHVLFSPQATDGRRAGLAVCWVWVSVGDVALRGEAVLGAGVWRGGEGGCGRGPGFFAPSLLRVCFDGKCSAKKGGVNDLGKSRKAF